MKNEGESRREPAQTFSYVKHNHNTAGWKQGEDQTIPSTADTMFKCANSKQRTEYNKAKPAS